MFSSLFSWFAGLIGRSEATGARAATQPPPVVVSAPTIPPGSTSTAAPAQAVGAPAAASARPRTMTPAEFIAAISPAARACMVRTRVPASVTIAQAADESAWGAHAPRFNLFGIKADSSWRGPVQTLLTHEVVNGKTIAIDAPFRAYSDWQGSVDDHAAFLTSNERYRPAFECTSGAAFAEAIARCGYATDPLYASKLTAIINAHDLNALDR